jgi:transcriptional regulator with PAS, ATPase and Fis domain
VDVRIITATNQDLSSAVQAGKFRSDLFYRLNVVPIHIPPLRERKDDLIPLVNHLLDKFASKYGKKIDTIPPEVMATFSNYDWPGNIRELENAMERMVVMSETDSISLDQVPSEIRGVVSTTKTSDLKATLDTLSQVTEKQMIIDALNKTNQNRTSAAKLLGISRRTLQNKIKEYGL